MKAATKPPAHSRPLSNNTSPELHGTQWLDLDWKHSGIAQSTGIDTCEPWLQETLLNSLLSSEHFAKTFLPETFNKKMTYQQKRVWTLMDNSLLPSVGMCCYRGFGKTSMAEARTLKGILFRLLHHIMFVGANHGSAAQSTENIKAELLTNYLIKEVFGDFKPKGLSDVPYTFSKKTYFLTDPKTGESLAVVHPKGVQELVRGTLIKVAGESRRPDFIFSDDVETDEGVMNEDTRKKVRNWFDNALYHCVSQERPNPRTGLWDRPSDDPFWTPPWQMMYADTLKHPDAHIAHLMSNTSWHFENFPQAEFREDSQGVKRLYSLVPEILSHEQVRVEYQKAKDSNNLDGYCQEKLCTPMSAEMAAFQREYFHYYDESTFIPNAKSMYSLNNAEDYERFLIVDPARTDSPHSCLSGILVCAANYEQGRIYFRRAFAERLSTKVLIDRVFDLAVDFRTKIVGIEITGLEDAGRHLFTSAAERRGMHLEFVWLDGRQLPKGDFGKGTDAAKRARASQILPYYEDHYVYHDRSLARGALEAQCLSYPKCAAWDLLDCAGYVPTMLAHGGRIFQHQPKSRFEPHSDPFQDDEEWDDWTEFIQNESFRIL